jgi:hypothetical protein
MRYIEHKSTYIQEYHFIFQYLHMFIFTHATKKIFNGCVYFKRATTQNI